MARVTTAVVVGSGPNGLAAAVTLAAAGVRVTVLESASEPGGGTRSRVSTTTGLLHDVCSGFHPLAVDTPFSRRFDLTSHGLRFALPPIQYAHPLTGGCGAAAHRSLPATAEHLGADGARWRRFFGPLDDRFDAIAAEFLRPMLHVPRHPFALARFGSRAALPAAAVARGFSTAAASALFAGVAAHAFRPLRSPLSSAIGVALGTAAHHYGWPVAVGGSAAIARAMIGRLEADGGRVVCDTTVGHIDELGDADIVLLDTAPSSAADILDGRQPRRVASAYRRYRHGPAAFVVSLAVVEGIPWSYEPARRAGTVHVGGTAAEVSAAEVAVWRGRLPTRPFVLVGQAHVADPARCSGDLVPIDAYAHVPAGHTGDVTDVIIDRIEMFAPGLRHRIRHVEARSTSAITAENANYVSGDIVTGANTARQLIFRPRVSVNPYRTGVPGAYLCSAATPPGAGAHGLCGWHAARTALADAGLEAP